jgi:Protein of unknown function (DUF3025)
MHTPVPVLVSPLDWDAVFFARHRAFAPIAPVAARFVRENAWPPVARWSAHLDDLALRTATGAPLRFVEAPPRRRRAGTIPIDLSTLYDIRIHERGEVASRERNWHDFLNMLCWATFPRAKAAISARQCRAVRAWIPPGATQLPGARTREQDALAILDEGGAVVACTRAHTDAIEDAIARGDEAQLTRIVEGGGARVMAFGHAAYEHLVARHPTVRAMPVTLPMDALPDTLSALVSACDEALTARVANPHYFTAPREDPAIPMREALLAV